MTFSIQPHTIFLLFAVLFSHVSIANDNQNTSNIDIPASNLVDALNQFAKQTNRALIYPYHLASSLNVEGIQGNYSASQALQLLLKNVPLKGVVRPSGVIQITKIQPVTSDTETKVVTENKSHIEPVPLPDEIEVIVVEGKMFAMDKSANFKRFSDSQTEQISQSQINQIAKSNAADVMRNVPSLSTDKVYGGGTHVSVRGFGPEFNNVLYNGRVIATENQGREFSFDVLSSDVIERVNVYKSPSTDLIAGSIGATINLVSPMPGSHLGTYSKSAVKIGYSQLSGKYFPEISQLFSYNNGDYGALVSVQYHEKDYRLESVNTDGWIPVDLAYLQPDGNDYSRVYVPRNYDFRIDEGKESRIGGNIVLQASITDKTLMTADLLYSKYEVDSHIKSSGNWTHVNPIGVESTLGESFQSVQVDNHNTLLGYRYREDGNFATDFVELNRNRPTSTIQMGLNFQHLLSDAVELTLDTSYSAAENNNGGKQQFIIAGVPFANPVYQYVPGAKYAELSYDREFGIEDIRSHGTIFNGENVRDEIFQTRLDLHWYPDLEWLKQFDMGVYQSARVKQRDGFRSPNGWEFAGYVFDIPDEIFSPFDASNFIDGGNPVDWYSFDAQEYVDYLWSDQHIQTEIIDKDHPLADSIWALKQAGGVEPVHYPSKSWQVEEQLLEGYVSVKFQGESLIGDWSGNLGVRFANTKVVSEGNQQAIRSIDTIEGDPTNLIMSFSSASDISETHSYSKLLPSFNIKLAMSEQNVLSLGLSKTMTRPTLSDLSITLGNYISRVGASLAFQGDARLKPTLSNNIDVNWNYYWDAYSVFELAYFYKDFSNYLSSKAEYRTLHDSQFGEYLVISPTNIADESVSGWELNVVSQFHQLPGVLKGLGGRFRFTDVDTSKHLHEQSNTFIPAIEGAADSYVAVLFYNLNNINANLSLFHRDSFLQSRIGLLGDVVMVAARDQFDFGLSYKHNNINISFDILNLTNEPVRSYSVYEERLINYINSGSDYSLSMSIEF